MTASPPKAQIIFVRHGQTAHNKEKRMQGHLDAPLDETGRAQAQGLARHLRALGVQNPSIHASDLRRAYATAEAIQAEVGGTLTPHRDLREIHMGDWEDCLYADIHASHPDEYTRFWQGDPDCRPPSGETPAEVARRVLAQVQRLWPQRGETVLIVSHGIAITGVLCELLGLHYQTEFRSGSLMHLNTAYSVLEVCPDTHQVLRAEVAQAGHLARG